LKRQANKATALVPSAQSAGFLRCEMWPTDRPHLATTLEGDCGRRGTRGLVSGFSQDADLQSLIDRRSS
jgi:hypothetical protein